MHNNISFDKTTKHIIAAVIGIAIIVYIGSFIYTRSPSQAELDRLRMVLPYAVRNVLGCDRATWALGFIEKRRGSSPSDEWDELLNIARKNYRTECGK